MYVGVFAFFVLGSGIVFLVFFNFFFNLWVCVLVVLVQDTLRSQFI